MVVALAENGVLYRIHTEYKSGLPALVSRHFEGFTILTGTGFHNGTQECAAIVEIIGDRENDMAAVRDLMADIHAELGQDVVLLAALEVNVVEIARVGSAEQVA